MDILFDLKELEFENIRDTTLGKYLLLSNLLCSDGVIRKGNFSQRKTIILKKEIMDYLRISNEKTFHSIFKELEYYNLARRVIISGKGIKIYINPKYCRHRNYKNNSECDNLFEIEEKYEQIKEYYVYRFTDTCDEIIYVGRTNNIKNRINGHMKNGHLPKECYDNVKKIEYIKLSGYADMCMYEIYYINKYIPKYNKINKKEEDKGNEVELKELEWIDFDYDSQFSQQETTFQKPITKPIFI